MTTKALSFSAPLSLAIANGATTPDPGGSSATGVQVWSTTEGKIVTWNGSSWQTPSTGSVAINQVEVTFPDLSYTTVISVNVPGVVVGQKIIASVDGSASSTGFDDDIEFDNIAVTARCDANDYIDFICTPIPGPISGKRKINYII